MTSEPDVFGYGVYATYFIPKRTLVCSYLGKFSLLSDISSSRPADSLYTLGYITFKNVLTSGRFYTYIFKEDFWVIGCFKGDTKKLKKHLKSKASHLQKYEYTNSIDNARKLRKVLKNFY
jgi:hypothetical protein